MKTPLYTLYFILLANSLHGQTPSDALKYTPQYNGNISAIKWSGGTTLKVDGSQDTVQNIYTYHYDAVNRLKEANYGSGTTTVGTWTTLTEQGAQ